MTIEEAIKIVGSELGEPSKMPGFSIGTPAKYCITGSRLRNVEGSTCHRCYAFRGNYTFTPVQKALERRFQGITHPDWVEAMCTLLKNQKMRKHSDYRFFRFHDSGDIQSVQHLENIAEICRRFPKRKFWLPTREYGLVRAWKAQGGARPKNLVIRLSGHMVGGSVPKALAKELNVQMSSVHLKGAPIPKGFTECKAYTRGNSCGEVGDGGEVCRKCWDARYKIITYPKH